ncbi:Pyruvate, phosphate dikinase, chloroplastic [Tetrabaena socialis]|uniref:Pyruvate, phosphate dikinase, chloroplastic n=1 Tax=Tetrabaena socialis TaxID=47790 RepID=A0A2J7ZQF2_9CHLO|nr:Pyruvate, phosphate dikinase, chloroplastic [Tetrabaena socialis]|eukprot:PNH02497.1 Pyruvate, phosphate dikinase, chloroplastic [Tetrabaena socialis]
MIVAQSKEGRLKALADLLPFQRADFRGILTAMEGLPVTIRLLDPPLHEFLPDGDMTEVCEALARDAGVTVDEVYGTIEKLQEVNPMLGFRGCRLGITYPEITEMQVRSGGSRTMERGATREKPKPLQFADEEAYKSDVLGTGLPASPGAAVGQAVFNAEDAEAWRGSGLPVVLVRRETSPEVYEAHIAEVRAVVPPEQLLLFTPREGWAPLCAFLGAPVPADQPFPHVNDKEDFSKRLLGARRQRVLLYRGVIAACNAAVAAAAAAAGGFLLARLLRHRGRKARG